MKSILNQNPLESEAIYIFREVITQFENPVLLFSGGKDSITLKNCQNPPKAYDLPFVGWIQNLWFRGASIYFSIIPTEFSRK